MRREALERYAVGRLNGIGVHDAITQSDIDRVLAGLSEKDRREYLESFAEEYIRQHIQKTINDNYHRIQADIQNIMDAHGIGVQEQGSGPSVRAGAAGGRRPQEVRDGIVEEVVPDEILYGDDEYIE